MLTNDPENSASAQHVAQIIADGHLPALDADLTRIIASGDPKAIGGWHCLLRGVGAAVKIGALPLPIHHEGALVARIVEVELRGDDWWGLVKACRGSTALREMQEILDRTSLRLREPRVERDGDVVHVMDGDKPAMMMPASVWERLCGLDKATGLRAGPVAMAIGQSSAGQAGVYRVGRATWLRRPEDDPARDALSFLHMAHGDAEAAYTVTKNEAGDVSFLCDGDEKLGLPSDLFQRFAASDPHVAALIESLAASGTEVKTVDKSLMDRVLFGHERIECDAVIEDHVELVTPPGPLEGYPPGAKASAGPVAITLKGPGFRYVLLTGQRDAKENGIYHAIPVESPPGHAFLVGHAAILPPPRPHVSPRFDAPTAILGRSMATGTAIAPGDTVTLPDGRGFVVKGATAGTSPRGAIALSCDGSGDGNVAQGNRRDRRKEAALQRRAARRGKR